jgi:alkylated DNA nucleotide flippase Atl1
VVNSRGELSEHFAFGGLDGQKQRLEADGIQVIDAKVDLSRWGWQFPSL